MIPLSFLCAMHVLTVLVSLFHFGNLLIVKCTLVDSFGSKASCFFHAIQSFGPLMTPLRDFIYTSHFSWEEREKKNIWVYTLEKCFTFTCLYFYLSHPVWFSSTLAKFWVNLIPNGLGALVHMYFLFWFRSNLALRWLVGINLFRYYNRWDFIFFYCSSPSQGLLLVLILLLNLVLKP